MVASIKKKLQHIQICEIKMEMHCPSEKSYVLYKRCHYL